MVKVNRINISQIEGGYSDDGDKRPNGEMALYNDDNGGFDLVIHDGVNSTNLNKVLGKGKLYGHGADSADGNGYDTIKLIPDIPAYNGGSNQYIIIDPTGPNHVHIRAGGTIDNSNSELIVGGENSNVKIGSGPDPQISIRANNKNWTFNTDGSSQSPSQLSITPLDNFVPVSGTIIQQASGEALNIVSAGSGASMAIGWVENTFSPGGVASITFNEISGETRIYTGAFDGIVNTWIYDTSGNLTIPGGISFPDGSVQTSAPTNLPTVVQLGSVSGTINTDATLGDIFDLTLAASGTLANPASGVDGQSLRWRITHDANNLTLNFGDKFKIPSSATNPLPISSTSGTMDLLGATYDQSRDKWDIISFVPGY